MQAVAGGSFAGLWVLSRCGNTGFQGWGEQVQSALDEAYAAYINKFTTETLDAMPLTYLDESAEVQVEPIRRHPAAASPAVL
jgi:hypothetical protein